MENRKCFKCGETKLITEFYKDKSEVGGRSYKCKVCSKKTNKDRYKNDPIKAQMRWKKDSFRIYMRNTLFIHRYLRMFGKCVDCGITDRRVLQFDHINRQEKSLEIGQMKTRSIKSVKNEIRKCEVRCCNCHKLRTGEQLNYMTHDEQLELTWKNLDQYSNYGSMDGFKNNNKLYLES